MADLDVPIALRRTRRHGGAGVVAKQEEEGGMAAVLAAPPRTPRRSKRAVRFSEPASLTAASSGLTPMVRRTYLGTPGRQRQQRRRASTPVAFRSTTPVSSRSAAAAAAPQALTSQALHRTMDGRVERRLRRTHLRNLLDKLDREQRHKAKAAQAQIEQLRTEIRLRDREIHELRNATVVIDTERIWDLEEQVGRLREELERRPAGEGEGRRQRAWWEDDEESNGCDVAGRDGVYAAAEDDGYTDMATMIGQEEEEDNDDDNDYFGDETMAHLITSTPSRTRSSFPTPPATSPVLGPGTPCSTSASRRGYLPSMMTPLRHTGVQVSLADPAKQQQLEEELSSLQREVGKLTATLDSYKNLGARLKQQLAEVASPLPLHSAAAAVGATEGDSVLEGKIATLLQTTAESSARVARLGSAIAQLGFPGGDTGEQLAAMAAGFRAARLELEYLTPGEVTLPLTSHGAQVLDLLLVRLRALAAKSSDDDDTIDEYHELEQSLRKQLDARVSALDELRGELGSAEQQLEAHTRRVHELEVANQRLRGAVDSYVRDMAELEALVQRMEHAQAGSEASTREAVGALEEQLADAQRQTTSLQQQVSDVQDRSTRHVVSLNRRHGKALALRDARVLELRAELDRVNAALRCAHESICLLRVEKGGLQTQRDAEHHQRHQAERAVDAIKAELQRVLHMSQRFLSSSSSGDGSSSSDMASPSDTCSPSTSEKGPATEADRKAQQKKPTKRRFDSGLGLLEEDMDHDEAV
ncbi:hypothetical protein E4U55_005178 [Claviceps digitariae]|nr:hypothetical protein E4U55_005178 [Claviceps digitariae]